MLIRAAIWLPMPRFHSILTIVTVDDCRCVIPHPPPPHRRHTTTTTADSRTPLSSPLPQAPPPLPPPTAADRPVPPGHRRRRHCCCRRRRRPTVYRRGRRCVAAVGPGAASRAPRATPRVHTERDTHTDTQTRVGGPAPTVGPPPRCTTASAAAGAAEPGPDGGVGGDIKG